LAVLRDTASRTLRNFLDLKPVTNLDTEEQIQARTGLMLQLRMQFPVFGRAVQWLHAEKEKLNDGWLSAVAEWLLVRRESIVANVASYEPDDVMVGLRDSWQEVSFGCPVLRLTPLFKTSARYFAPPIRVRPKYPNLEANCESHSSNSGKRKHNDDACNKYFTEYTQGGLTGGCQVLCCTHHFFYGFHFFNTFEGRNDMFSAIYTRYKNVVYRTVCMLTVVSRFPEAPEVVVHDFACSLADYCMSREPMYFKDTLFIVDSFHARNHKACTQSSKLYAYKSDPKINALNSNAAEHLNSGLRHLRRSMSGMGEARSISYMNTYICVRNRMLLYQHEQLSTT
jgi:hypothetical protein